MAVTENARQWLGMAFGATAVELITLPDCERLPLLLGVVDERNQLYGVLGRAGWVCVCLHDDQVVSLRDGDPLRATRLPDAWGVVPAADPALVIGKLRTARPAGETKWSEMRSSTLTAPSCDPWRRPSGGLPAVPSSGVLVDAEGLLTWDGALSSLPVDGDAFAVRGGRDIVTYDEGQVRCLNTHAAEPRPSPVRRYGRGLVKVAREHSCHQRGGVSVACPVAGGRDRVDAARPRRRGHRPLHGVLAGRRPRRRVRAARHGGGRCARGKADTPARAA